MTCQVIVVKETNDRLTERYKLCNRPGINMQTFLTGLFTFRKILVANNLIMYLATYISPCDKAHKTLTFSFQSLRFAARAQTVAQYSHSSIILLQFVLGRPSLLLPSGLYSNAVTQCSSLFFLIICPIW